MYSKLNNLKNKNITWTTIMLHIHKQLKNTYLLEILHPLTTKEGHPANHGLFITPNISIKEATPELRLWIHKGEFLWFGSSLSHTTQFPKVSRQFPTMAFPINYPIVPLTLHNTKNGIPLIAKQCFKVSHFPPIL
jgi:hypothetical protein